MAIGLDGLKSRWLYGYGARCLGRKVKEVKEVLGVNWVQGSKWLRGSKRSPDGFWEHYAVKAVMGWDGTAMSYPLDCYDYQSTCCASNLMILAMASLTYL